MGQRQTPAAAYRGELVDFVDDPARAGRRACRHVPDGLLIVRDGRIEASGPFEALRERVGWPAAGGDSRSAGSAPGEPVGSRAAAAQSPAQCSAHGVALHDLRGLILMPGFVDAHVHYAQTDVIASYGERLLDWLERYTFPAERRFADPEHAARTATFFLDELLRNGTTTAMVWATVHEHSVDAVLDEARARGMRLIAGKVLMDRNCPGELCEAAGAGSDATRRLIERWHGRGRLGYAITPRFAPTSSPRQLAAAADLLDAYPGVWLQSHLAENLEELRWVAELFPQARSYTDVYERAGLLRGRSVWAHGIHLDDHDRQRLAANGAAIAFCPSSNLFLGSGLFDAAAADRAGVRLALATDIGAGSSFSMLRTMAAGYEVLQLAGQTLSPLRGFYLATLGGARALGLDAWIGSFDSGREADFVALDPRATPLLARRSAVASTLDERLFALMMLGDDRAVGQVWIAGAARGPRS